MNGQNQEHGQGNVAGSASTSAPQKSGGSGGNLGLVILVLVALIAGGVYFMRTREPAPDTPTPAAEQTALRVWWQQGFYPEETQEIQRIVREWEEKTGHEVELMFYSDADMLTETQNALAAINPPEMLFSTGRVETLIPSLAWNNQLADLSDVIEPLRGVYTAAILDAVQYQDPKTGKPWIFAAPIAQQTIHNHYWRPYIEQAGFKDDQIPMDWKGFWQFWKDVQDRLHEQGLDKVYGLGLPMSPAASDTYFTFEQFLEAHGVKLLDSAGKLRTGDARVRQGMIDALTEYTTYFKDGYVPPSATEWGNPENNRALLSRDVVMTPNPSLSIPGSQRENPQVYKNELVTIDWPHTLDGRRLSSVTSVKMVVIFRDSPNQELAKSLLAHLIQPENIGSYLKGAHGRYFPVMPVVLDDPFWTNPDDPHISASAQQYRDARSFPQSFNPAYTRVLSDNVWGQVIRAIVVDGISPEEAADRAIEKITAIFATYQ